MSFSKPADFEEPVVVYQTRWCGFCGLAKKLLSQRGVPYATVDVTRDAAARAWLLDTSGQQTVPQIFVHGESIGGFTELSQLDQSGALKEKIARS